MKELFYGFYGTRIYLPMSDLSRRWRRMRQKQGRFLQQVNLPRVSWRSCTLHRTIKVWEHEKANGNIRISELGVINAVAAGCENGTNIFEIGTFDGRTSLNLSFSTPVDCNVYTLDLPPDENTKYSLASGERHMVDKDRSGGRVEKYTTSHSQIVGKIHQLYGDSAKFDFSPYHDTCSLVFVDGSHTYEYAMADTASAKRMVKKGGAIIWHDYGIWEGVTRALEELEERENLGLKNISGTSLVYWKND